MFRQISIAILLTITILLLDSRSVNAIATNKTNQEKEKIRIGLLVSGSDTLEAIRGARMAINKANTVERNNKVEFKLVVYSTDGPWGVGTKKAVELIYQHKVAAIVGALDGRNAHLAEQVSAKSQMVFISSWATESTLSQAYVSWYFRCIPNDLQQAEILLRKIHSESNHNKILLIGEEDNYDSKSAVSAISKKAKTNKQIHCKNLLINPGEYKEKEIRQTFDTFNPDAIIICGDFSSAINLKNILVNNHVEIPVFGNIAAINSDIFGRIQDVFEFTSLRSESFYTDFNKKYGYYPGYKAMFSFDAINLLVKTIDQAGSENEAVKDHLKSTGFDGVSGKITFDQLGNRIIK